MGHMKAKKTKPGSKSQDADVWASPEFKNLSLGLEKILKLPKVEIDKRLAEDHARKIRTDRSS